MAKPYSTPTTTSYSAEAYSDCTNAKLKFVYMPANFGVTNEIENNIKSLFFEANFTAFITEFSERFVSSWDSEQFYGKSEPIAGFKNTKRVISLSWQVPAVNISVATANYIEIDKLQKMVYPTYSEYLSTFKEVDKKSDRAGFDELFMKKYGARNDPQYSTALGRQLTEDERVKLYSETQSFIDADSYRFHPHGVPISKPPLIGLKWNNLIKNRDTLPYMGDPLLTQGANDLLLGYLENISLNIDLEAGFFTSSGNLYPKNYTLSCTFVVQHTHELGRNQPLW